MCLSLLDRCSQQDARTSAHGWSRQKAPARQLNLCFVRSLLWLFVSSSFSGLSAPKHSSSSQWPSDSLLKDTDSIVAPRPSSGSSLFLRGFFLPPLPPFRTLVQRRTMPSLECAPSALWNATL
ncbi:hypothetical protein CI102_3500 [Trichoderma harzianum]|nr:hypothetical protein CI102_3500 [Trichoderma harzianum]